MPCRIACRCRKKRITYHAVAWAFCAAATLLPSIHPTASAAAEFRLKSSSESHGPIVTLGDVADIVANSQTEIDTLAAVELFPAPVATRPRYVRLREIQDALLLCGVNLTEHRFSGSSQVMVTASGISDAQPDDEPVTFAMTRRAKSQLERAIERCLQQQVSAEQPWVVEVELPSAQTRLLADPSTTISVSGGEPPFTGMQRFVVSVDTAGNRQQFEVDASVAVPPASVCAIRSLPRGAMIRATDVALAPADPTDPMTTGSFFSLAEVVGKEATQSIPQGRFLTAEQIRSPLMVQRGEVVTVSARSSGIVVRTAARAREQGSHGDLIAVESLNERQIYFARVCGVREVEVFAHAPRATTASAPGVVRR